MYAARQPTNTKTPLAVPYVATLHTKPTPAISPATCIRACAIFELACDPRFYIMSASLTYDANEAVQVRE